MTSPSSSLTCWLYYLSVVGTQGIANPSELRQGCFSHPSGFFMLSLSSLLLHSVSSVHPCIRREHHPQAKLSQQQAVWEAPETCVNPQSVTTQQGRCMLRVHLTHPERSLWPVAWTQLLVPAPGWQGRKSTLVSRPPASRAIVLLHVMPMGS
jgi:hypothetical protein